MTQGLVTIMHGGKVVMKIVAGCDGMNARKVANAIRKLGRIPSLKNAYEIAEKVEFGSAESLVVMGEKRSKLGGSKERLGPLYRKTFSQPRFNPRWKRGTADHIVVIDL
ncbi:MAG: hypothetical protein Q7S86_02500 [bacterium]|nr:hypothetical protein [bacterium]